MECRIVRRADQTAHPLICLHWTLWLNFMLHVKWYLQQYLSYADTSLWPVYTYGLCHKFIIVPMVMDGLMDRMDLEPILSVNISLTVMVMETAYVNGPLCGTRSICVQNHTYDSVQYGVRMGYVPLFSALLMVHARHRDKDRHRDWYTSREPNDNLCWCLSLYSFNTSKQFYKTHFYLSSYTETPMSLGIVAIESVSVSVSVSVMMSFHYPTPVPIPIVIPIPIICRKAPLGPIPMVIPCKVTMKITFKKPPCWYWYQYQIGYSTHLHGNRNCNRFSGNSSAHYYISHLNRSRNRNRNQNRAVETQCEHTVNQNAFQEDVYCPLIDHISVSCHIPRTHPGSNHACPPSNHTCPPRSNHACPPGSNHACPPEQPCMPPRSNHAHPPWSLEQPCMPLWEQPRTPPPEQPCMPPQSNHACPPREQPCTPPRATTHAPQATTHAPPCGQNHRHL